MRRKKRPLTSEERVREQILEERIREKRLEEWRKKKSKCLEGRLEHYFRAPMTGSLTPDLKCKWCGKTVAQVKAEQRRRR